MTSSPGRNRSRTGTRRLGWGLLDAGVSSIGNLAISVFAARTMSVSDFGVFTTAMLAMLLLTGLSRSTHGDVLVLTSASGTAEERVRRGQSSLDSTLAVALVVAGLGLLAGLTWEALDGRFLARASTTVLACAAVAPLLLLQDHYRWIEYARGRGSMALGNNAVWTTTAFALVAIAHLLTGGASSPWLAVLMWGAGTIPAIVFGRASTGLSPRLRRRASWLRENRVLVGKLVQDYGLLQASAQGALLLLAGLSSPADIGLFRKAQIFLAPVNVATNGLMSALQPVLVTAYAKAGHRGVVAVSMRIAGVATVAVLAYGALVLSLPSAAAGVLIGDGWSDARMFLPPLLIHVGAGLVGGCAGLSLRAVGLVGRQVRVRWLIAPLSVLALTVGTLSGGAVAGVWALAGAGLLATTIWTALLFDGRGTPADPPGVPVQASQVSR